MNAIEELENLPGILFHDKANILLVHAEIKPTALVVLEGDVFGNKNSPTHINQTSLATLDDIFSEFGISYVRTVEIMDALKGGYVEVVRFFIAHDQSTANKLKTLFDDVSNNHREIGILLGYPQTAVDAFLTPGMLDQENTPESTKEVSKLNMRLLGHRLSKDNWREEVKYLEESGNYIKSISPLIYKEVTHDR